MIMNELDIRCTGIIKLSDNITNNYERIREIAPMGFARKCSKSSESQTSRKN